MLGSVPMSKNNDDLSVSAAAEHAGVSRKTAYEWMGQGLPYRYVTNDFGIGTKRVIRQSEMDRWIKEQRRARGAK